MLEAKSLSFAYQKNKYILNDISFSIAPGERVAIEGPSGRGKTTLCRLLGGYLTPSFGSVLLNGKPLPLKGFSPVQIIFQNPEYSVDPLLTLEESLNEAGMPKEDIIKGLGIKKEWLKRYPSELSGGELQRCCIARALNQKAQYLICDEATTMLDLITQQEIWDYLLNVCTKNNMGLIMVSHSERLKQKIVTRRVTI